jgi:Ca2+/H+ antiporter
MALQHEQKMEDSAENLRVSQTMLSNLISFKNTDHVSEPHTTEVKRIIDAGKEADGLHQSQFAEELIAKMQQLEEPSSRNDSKLNSGKNKMESKNDATVSAAINVTQDSSIEAERHKSRARKSRLQRALWKIGSSRTEQNGALSETEDGWEAHDYRRRHSTPKRFAKLKLSRLRPHTYDDHGRNSTTWAYFVFSNRYRLLVCAFSVPFIPAGFAVSYAHADPIAVFAVNFCGIFASANIVTMMMECLMPLFGMAASTLIYEFLSNFPQIVACGLLLRSRQIKVLQSSILGGILSTLLLMIGLGMFLGGVNRIEQYFNRTVVQTIAVCMFLATGTLLVPSFMKFNKVVSANQVANTSRAASALLITAYLSFLLFKLKSHSQWFEKISVRSQTRRHRTRARRIREVLPRMGAMAGSIASSGSEAESGNSEDERGADDGSGGYHASSRSRQGLGSSADEAKPSGASVSTGARWKRILKLNQDPASLVRFSHYRKSHQRHHFYSERSRLVLLPIWMLVIGLIVGPVLLTFNTSFAVDSLDGMLARTSMSKTFLSFVLLPLFNNDPDTIGNAMEDKMDLCIQRNIGKSMQTAMLVIPFVVLVAWCMGVEDMTLVFDSFQVTAVFVAVLLISFAVRMGKSDW